MKNDLMKRALCMVCCLSLTLGVFTYRPPKAEASFVSGAAALGCAILISTIIGTTADMAFDDVVVENIGTVIDPFVQEFVDFAGGVYENVNEVYSTIAGSANPLAGGVLALSDEAGALIARFINWLQTEKGLVIGGEPFVVPPSCVSPTIDGGFVTWSYLDSSGVFHRGDYWPVSSFDVYFESIDTRIRCVDTGSDWFDIYINNTNLTSVHYSSTIGFYYNSSNNRAYLAYVGASTDSVPGTIIDITFHVSDLLSSLSFLSLSLQPEPEFQSIPNEVPVGQALTVNTGLTDLSFTDEQAAADAILSAALAGTLSPTVAVEDTATDIPGTDTETGTDTDDSILSWTKKIWQTVTDIPSAIAEAIASVFAPDAELINEITGTFSEKFGFVATLKTIGDDLFGMTPSSEPPVVWIHLEDAEGMYYYGGTVKALDMSWFQRYKEDVDRILGGFLWFAYLWLLFRRLPDILGGAGLVIADSQYISDGMYVDGNTGEITGRFTYRRSKRL